MVGHRKSHSTDDDVTTAKQDIEHASQPTARSKTPHNTKVPRPRWVLHLQAQVWRFLMGIGMYLHRLAPPHPPKPAFTKTVTAQLSGKPGLINLYFYTPRSYEPQRRLWKDKPLSRDDHISKDGKRKSVISQVGDTIKRKSSISRKWGLYPVVINFHGGGFTLGHPSDDARWCGTVVDECNAVVVAVEYRLAPENPFPVAVEDGVDAVIWIHQHAQELGIDPDKIALSGFSSGGNMAFTVPLRLYDELHGVVRDGEDVDQAKPSAGLLSASHPDVATASSSSSSNAATNVKLTNTKVSASLQSKNNTAVTAKRLEAAAKIDICAIVPWYPSLDYTRTREQRRATCVRKDQELPALFTDLFDQSYLHPPNTIELNSPYLSPGVAPTSLLKNALPQEIIMHTCEWDMLLDEGQIFHERLVAPPLNKNVFYKLVEGVPHGWDKAPNPLKPTPGVREHYLRACKELRRIFNPPAIVEHSTEYGISAAPRGSVQFVR